MANAALNPAVAPWIVYAMFAVLVVVAFVIAVVVTLSRVRAWLQELFFEFSRSHEFEATLERILDRLAVRLLGPVETKITAVEADMTALERRDDKRASAVARCHRRIDNLQRETEKEVREIYKRLPKSANG